MNSEVKINWVNLKGFAVIFSVGLLMSGILILKLSILGALKFYLAGWILFAAIFIFGYLVEKSGLSPYFSIGLLGGKKR